MLYQLLEIIKEQLITFSLTGMENSLRLRYGTSPYDGRLEIFHDGQWGAVCDDLFSKAVANVACNQLGFGKAISYKCCSNIKANNTAGYKLLTFDGLYWLDNLICKKGAKKLTQCRHNGWGINNCGIREAVSIECEGKVE